MPGTDLIRAQKLIEQKLVGFKTKGYDPEAIRQGAYNTLYALREAQAGEVSASLASLIASSAGAGLASTADQLGYLEEQLGPVAQSNGPEPRTSVTDDEISLVLAAMSQEQLEATQKALVSILKDTRKKPKDAPAPTSTENDGVTQ